MPRRPHLIETDQRQQDQVQCPDRPLAFALDYRFGDAEAVGSQLFTWLETLEHHARGGPGVQHRQVDVLAAPVRLAQQQARVDLAVIGQVQGDMPGAAEQWMLRQLAIKAFGGLALLGGCESAAGIAQEAAKLGAGERRGVGHGTGDP